ncbi:squalene/phytoene synthase family protein [Cellulomonas sp. P24]|uniref:phytoene/squalene synthase family protein n=1 Tax=Cellulomonas sp. P24 TaxID=2885206 RepID=UPI0028701D12|nr:squalene/phytoene synthase family protein [Cellulomonas sp. P24]
MSLDQRAADEPTRARDVYDDVAAASAAIVIRRYSTSFSLACRLLDEPVRTRVQNIYALVRLADEIVDGPFSAVDPDRTARQLDALEAETYDAVRAGCSTNLVVHAFAQTARTCRIGPDLIGPFFASMRADLDVSSHDAESLSAYVYGSAEVVGLMCLRAFLAGQPHDPGAYARLAPGAQRLGAAFQKVNFLRDLAADHDVLGRTYVAAVDVEHLTDAERDALLDEVDADLAAAARAITHLPRSSRRAVSAAHGLFAELSRRLRRTPASEIARTRVRVPTVVKAWVVLRAIVGSRAVVPARRGDFSRISPASATSDTSRTADASREPRTSGIPRASGTAQALVAPDGTRS